MRFIAFVRRIVRTIIYKIELFVYLQFGKKKEEKGGKKYLYASPVGKAGKAFLKNILETFTSEDFDFLIFVYDETVFDEEIFKKCSFIYGKGLKWEFARKHLTPERCKNYHYIFYWDDDIDVRTFSPTGFIGIMEKNKLQMAQPALTKDSYFSFSITLQNENCQVGRYTDFVEVMVPVFDGKSWTRFYKKFVMNGSKYGWGYDGYAKKVCHFHAMAIVDCAPVKHCRPLSGPSEAIQEHEKFKKKYRFRGALNIVIGPLKQ